MPAQASASSAACSVPMLFALLFLSHATTALPILKKRGIPRMKKALSLLLALLVLMVLSAGALADSSWNVLPFLSIADRPEAAALAQPVNGSATDGQVSIAVDSALFDGVNLAFDWTVTNAEPDKPAFLQVDDFTINGIKTAADNTDSFDGMWLDENDEQGTSRNGENIELPEGVTGDTLHVSLTVGVYYPNAPIYRMDKYDEALAKQKLAEGFFVIPENDGYLVLDPVEGMSWVVDGASKEEGGMFTYKAVTITFDVDATPGRKAAVQLKTEPSYAVDKYTVTCRKAVLTPVALYLSMLASPSSADNSPFNDGEFVLAGAHGKPLSDVTAGGESGGEMQADGTMKTFLNFIWHGIPDGMPPEQFSIVFVPYDGSKGFSLPMSR